MNRCRANARQATPTFTSTLAEAPYAREGGHRDARAAEWLAAYLLAVILDDDHKAMQHVRHAVQQVAHRTQEINV